MKKLASRFCQVSLIALSSALVFSAAASAASGTKTSRPSKMFLSSTPSGARDRLPLTRIEVTRVGGESKEPAGITGTPGSSAGAVPEDRAFGSSSDKWPYTAARVAVEKLGDTGLANTPVSSKPYRQTGKLMMRFGADWFNCTASLIKKSLLITAAHCVHNFGEEDAGFADEVLWFPANTKDPETTSGGPYGSYAGIEWRIPSPYHDGTDTCQAGAGGVVCNNDLATVVLEVKAGVTAGKKLGGNYDYGWNGVSSIKSPAFGNATVSDISQLGYPVAFDSGFQMQRNNSFGKFIQGTGSNGKVLKQTQLGSALTGGSSGGPWLVNFGTRPKISAGGASLGSDSLSNTVVGVTSWGFTTVGVNVQGSSFFGQNAEYPDANYGGFGAGNIGFLVQNTCVANPTAC